MSAQSNADSHGSLVSWRVTVNCQLSTVEGWLLSKLSKATLDPSEFFASVFAFWGRPKLLTC